MFLMWWTKTRFTHFATSASQQPCTYPKVARFPVRVRVKKHKRYESIHWRASCFSGDLFSTEGMVHQSLCSKTVSGNVRKSAPPNSRHYTRFLKKYKDVGLCRRSLTWRVTVKPQSIICAIKGDWNPFEKGKYITYQKFFLRNFSACWPFAPSLERICCTPKRGLIFKGRWRIRNNVYSRKYA